MRRLSCTRETVCIQSYWASFKGLHIIVSLLRAFLWVIDLCICNWHLVMMWTDQQGSVLSKWHVPLRTIWQLETFDWLIQELLFVAPDTDCLQVVFQANLTENALVMLSWCKWVLRTFANFILANQCNLLSVIFEVSMLSFVFGQEVLKILVHCV